VVTRTDLELEARIGHASGAVNQGGNGLAVLAIILAGKTLKNYGHSCLL
jgi:hypothetical protein